MKPTLRAASVAALIATAIVNLGAQSKAILPFDHIHVNEPAAEGSQWWEKNIPGGRRIAEAPNRIMYGAVRLMFLSPRSNGGSDGSVIEHLGFSVANLDATIGALTAAGVKIVEPITDTPGLYKHAMIEDPWGTRIQLVQDPELLGLHHVQLRSPDTEGMYRWLLDKFGGERTKMKGQIDAVSRTAFPASPPSTSSPRKAHRFRARDERSITSAGGRSARSTKPRRCSRPRRFN